MKKFLLLVLAYLPLVMISSPPAWSQVCNPGVSHSYTAGLADDLSLPTEPASRSAALSAAFPAASWKDFDDVTFDRLFGHTFSGLPAGIVRAELVIRMKPSSFGSSNDALSLGLSSGSSFAFSSSIASLPGAGGTWNSNPTTTFSLELGSLPSGGNILGKLASDRFLDVLVQDDTAVDWMELQVWTCSPPPANLGLQHNLACDYFFSHNPLSGAERSLTRDQLHTVLGVIEDYAVTQGLDRTEGEGIVEGLLERLDKYGMFYEKHGQELFGAPVVSDELMPYITSRLANEGAISRELANQSNRVNQMVVERTDPAVVKRYVTENFLNHSWSPHDRLIAEAFVDIYTHSSEYWASRSNGGTGPVGTFLADVSGVEMGFALGGGPWGGFFGGVFFSLVSHYNLLVVPPTPLPFHGHFVTPVNDASLDIDLGSLHVFHFPEDEEGGVAFDLGKAGAVEFSLDPVDPEGDAPVDAFVEASTTGSIGGRPGLPLSRLRITKRVSGLEITAEFPSSSSPLQHVQLLRGGEVVAELHDRSGPAAFAFDWPWRRNWNKHCWPFPCEEILFPGQTILLLAGRQYVGDEIRVFPEGSGPAIDYNSALTFRVSGIPELTIADANIADAAGCTPGPTQLCLSNGRFKVETSWRTRDGNTGAGQAVQLTSDTGYFWFFGPDNVEMILKVLDACTFNQRFWVFAGGLTDVEVLTTVTDTAKGTVKTYTNPLGTAFRPILDTDTFSTCSAAAGAGSALEASQATSLESTEESRGVWLASVNQPPTTALLLNNNRFRVEIEWKTADGKTGLGQAVPLTSDTGYFWFFGATNVEVVVKVLNGCGLNQRYWVYAGGLTDVMTRMTVTDTVKGRAKTYENPQGNPFQPLLDSSAFATCP